MDEQERNPFDDKKDVSGFGTAENVLDMLSLVEYPLPIGATFLGLAAGGARAELYLANRIEAEQIFLVDRDSSSVEESDKVHPIKADIFEFLEHFQGIHFNVVTLFAAEYLVDTPSKLSQLLQLVASKLKPGATVLIEPLETRSLSSTDLEAVLTELHFTRLPVPQGRLYLVYQG